MILQFKRNYKVDNCTYAEFISIADSKFKILGTASYGYQFTVNINNIQECESLTVKDLPLYLEWNKSSLFYTLLKG